MYIFSIPDANDNTIGYNYNIRLINWGLLEAIKQHQEWFYDDFIIETAYGCPPGCIWNGNRCIGETDEFDDDWAETVVGMYKSYGVEYRLVFTNFLLKKEHLSNKLANQIALAVSKIGGYVMVSTNLMANHMKHYSGLKICWSTTTDFGKTVEAQIKKINELSKTNLVVLPYEFNNKQELNQFVHPENLEVLGNEHCIDNCPNRREHWSSVNKAILEWDNPKSNAITECKFSQLYRSGQLRLHNITRDMLPVYEKMGINHFKISGRLEPDVAVPAYQHYFVRPEYLFLYEGFMKDFLTKFGEEANQ
ncbi:MAG: hypothetical protein KBS60_06645 [Phascolarctobacterium sp.]|nr:hypothetical protein [Candidatus Phascolarctobacterium caballi]